MNETKKLLMLDASAFKRCNCSLNFWYSIIEGRSNKLENNDTEFGSAVHHFRSNFKAGKPQAEAVLKAFTYFDRPMRIKHNKQFLTLGFLSVVCNEYLEEVLLKDNTSPLLNTEGNPIAIEKRFAIPYYVDDEVEVVLVGTMDEIAFKKETGEIIIEDLKVTAFWDVENFLNKFFLSSQLMFYRWAIRELLKIYPDSDLAKAVGQKEVGCMIDGIFYKAPSARSGIQITFKRSEIIYFPPEDLDELDKLIRQRVAEIVTLYKHHTAHQNRPLREGLLTGACNSGFECQYFKVCSIPGGEFGRELALKNDFIIKPYDPRTHGE